MDSLVEARGGLWGWCSSDCLLQIDMCLAIIQLDSLYPPEEVVIAGMLGVSSRYREGGFGDEFVGLIVQAVVEVTSEESVNQRCLSLVIMPK